MGLCGLAYLLFRHQLVRVFISAQQQAKLSPEQLQESLRIGAWVLIVAAGFQCFDALGIAYSGALRGAGDTLWPMAATLALSWGVMVPAGIAMVRLAPQLTSIGPWIAASGYVIILGLVLARRFESGAWRKIDLLGRVPAAAPVPAEPVSALGAVPQPGPRDGDEPGPA
jgi:MATE family multidrug resistance protein